VTRLLSAIGSGDREATDRLLLLLYDELRSLAAARMAREPPGQTLQATALVHEAYLRLVGDPHAKWQNRGHFFAAAAQAMRRILVERARHYRRAKHGGGKRRLEVDASELVSSEESTLDLVALDEALARLEKKDERMARVVMLRFFAGLEVDDTAAALGISPRTVKREWAVAKAWLYRQMEGSRPETR